VYLYGADAVLANSTVSGNTGSSAVSLYDAGETLQLIQSTVTANGAEGLIVPDGTTTLLGTIVSGNTGTDIADSGNVDSDHSLIGTTSGTTINDLGGTVTSTTPGLGPLADNGGLTQTHLPDETSPAIDAGATPVPTFPENTIDQRGEARVVNGTVDIGSVEYADTIPPTVSIVSPADGATYAVGQEVLADYSCADTGGSGLVSCTGDEPNGEPVATDVEGTFTFAVTAIDGAGNQTTVEATYTVAADVEPSGPPPIFAAPTFTG
jgi:hypothetical protein